MTATVTALIELATEHGWGIAFLVIGAQVVLDRLIPVEHLVARLVSFRGSAPARGAHRQVRAPRAKSFCTE